MMQQTIAGVLLLFAATVCGVLAIIIARRRSQTPTAYALVTFLIGLAWWSGTYALHWFNIPGPAPFFWLDMTYFGVVVVPAAFLVFALGFTSYSHLITPRLLALLTIEPVVILIVLWTDSGDGLFFAGTRAATDGAIETGGPIYWLNIAYSYLLMGLGIAVLIRDFQRSPLYRRQVGVVLFGVFVSWAINIASITPLNPFSELDPTSFSFTFAGVALAYSLFRYRLLDVVPIARHALVEQMNEGVLVLDRRNHIVDANPAIGRMLEIQLTDLVGRPADSVLAPWKHLLDHGHPHAGHKDEILRPGPPPVYLDVHLTPLLHRDGQFTGRLIVVRDVTERKQAELGLIDANQRLQAQLHEITVLQEQLREHATRDPLTGLFNRRYMEDSLTREVAEATRARRPLSVLIVDVDLFKQVNDTYGHLAGDRLLQALAELLTADTRGGDIVSRYGGEEFVVILPGATAATAAKRAEGWRAEFASLKVRYQGTAMQGTLSIGIAAFSEHGHTPEELLHAADRALYQAKATGRDRVVVSSHPHTAPLSV
jgi:diguanylate cyclase (GGDEF)-like protein/PAS domain S-box-containing protein